MKLLTKENIKALPPLYSQEDKGDEAVAHVKFFSTWSGWTWYATEYDGKDTFFGLTVGFERELGYFTLSELESVTGPAGLKIERDRSFPPTALGQLK